MSGAQGAAVITGALERAAEQMQQAAELIAESNARHERAIRDLIDVIVEDNNRRQELRMPYEPMIAPPRPEEDLK